MQFRLGSMVPLALLLIDGRGNNNKNNNRVEAFSTTSSFTAYRKASPIAAAGNTLSHRRSVLPQNSAHSSSRSTSTNLSMVIDKMSQECIAATTVAHKLGNEWGLRLLKNEALITGIVTHPERSSRTLAKYNIRYPLVKRSSKKILLQNGFVLQTQRSFNADSLIETAKPLPFSEEVKMTLTQADKIRQHFEAESIRSEHVLLALLGYNYGKPMDLQANPVGLQVLRNSEDIINRNFSAYEFCEELVQDMGMPYNGATVIKTTSEETVVIGGGSTKTNTLEEVGVDLTQMAVEGKLDRVYGREKEINMAMRTLGRRRKNNPCLIGDPGVGKVSNWVGSVGNVIVAMEKVARIVLVLERYDVIEQVSESEK